MNSALEIIGQILGVVAVICGFVSYQMRTQKQLLVVNTITCAVFCLHYILIGALSGCALNALCIFRNFAYFYRNKKYPESKVIPILFTVAMAAVGALSWHAWYSVLSVIGLVVNTWYMAASNPQTVRKSILFSSPLVLLYDVFVLSLGGIVYESVAIISAIIGMVRFRKNQLPAAAQEENA